MATGPFTTTTSAVFVPEVWSSELIRARESRLVAAKLVKRFDAEVENYGDVIHVPEVSNLSAQSVTEGSAVTWTNVSESEKTITINKEFAVPFKITYRLKDQAKYRVASEYIQKAGYALAKQMDSDILALYSSAANYVGDGSTNITKTNILAAQRILDSADVPTEDRHLIVEAYGRQDLYGIDDFVRYDATGKVSPAVNNGEGIGSIYNFTVHFSNNVPVETASPNVIHGLAFHRDAIGLAVQREPKFEKDKDLDYVATKFLVTCLYGVGVLRSDHMVDFRYAQS